MALTGSEILVTGSVFCVQEQTNEETTKMPPVNTTQNARPTSCPNVATANRRPVGARSNTQVNSANRNGNGGENRDRVTVSREVQERQGATSGIGGLLGGLQSWGSAAGAEQSGQTRQSGQSGASGRSLGELLEGRPRHVRDALSTGEAQSFTNSRGQTHQISIRPTCSAAGPTTESYNVRVGNDQVTVTLPANSQAREDVLRRITDYYSQQPDNLREAVRTIEVRNERNPDDAEWERRCQRPGFTSAATGGNSGITFWNGEGNVTEQTFAHEFGHNVGGAVRQAQDRETGVLGQLWNGITDLYSGGDDYNTPRGYRWQMQGENGVSEYAGAAPNEDFAETYAAYQQARDNGTLDEFRRRHPQRVAVIENEVLNRTLA